MKILLVGINSKFIHSNPALYYLKSYAEKYAADRNVMQEMLEIREYTINQDASEIISDIFEASSDVVCFSSYIWNISIVEKVIRTLKKVAPSVDIWLGGPEVSFGCEAVFERLPEIRGIMAGEGEAIFLQLCEAYEKGTQEGLGKILKADGCLNLDSVPFPYGDVEQAAEKDDEPDCGNAVRRSVLPEQRIDISRFQNRIIYYESGRGCPYACSYCLSSVDRHVRLRSMALVEKELQAFLDVKVPQVKFVDRTFNCNREHTKGILEYIKEHDNGITNFHFEIAAEVLNDSEIELLSTLRRGQVQLEIGVQTVNPETLKAINRHSDPNALSTIVERLLCCKNMHVHLDLIAGLPYEDIVSFRHSFNVVYSMHGDNLQLGFLKVLKGSPMSEKMEEYGLVYSDEPPYEVLSTKWLAYSDVLELKRVEEMLEVYHNSLQFRNTLQYIEGMSLFETWNPEGSTHSSDLHDMYGIFFDISEYYRRHGLDRISHSRYDRYRILREWWLEKHPEDSRKITELLMLDLYLRDNVKSRPDYAASGIVDREKYRAFFESGEYKKYLSGYDGYSSAQVSRMVHIEKMSEGYCVFDYLNRDPITDDANIAILPFEIIDTESCH